MGRVFSCFILVVFIAGCSTVPVATENSQDDFYIVEEVNQDPWEGFNRAIFTFNDTLDQYILKPVAKGYRYITPNFVDNGITNFFGNLQEPLVIVNDLLQGKFLQAGQDTLRFIVNSTVGIIGFLDVASKMDLPAHDEDFGQTLGYWGMPSGPYLMLPFWGPTTVRDGFTIIPDGYLNLVGEFNPEADRNALVITNIVDDRADLIPIETAATGDRYIFLREAFLQKREYDVQDGEVKDTFGDDDD
ncbi:MAG: VacJ family lipoprotein [Pseudomonadales bacterium]|nr:VacJ family lipoprotein [Pseudomonadales bacterium]